MTLDSFLIIVLGPFIAWILISGILYVLCRWFSGTGTFMATLQNTGYCVLPLTIFTVIMLIGNMAAVQFMAIPYAMVFEVTLGVVLFSFLFTIWSGDLLTFALEKTHAITHVHAIIAVVIAAVLLFILYMIIIPRPCTFYSTCSDRSENRDIPEVRVERTGRHRARKRRECSGRVSQVVGGWG